MNKKVIPESQQLSLFCCDSAARDGDHAEDPAKARRKAIARALYERYYGGGK